MNSTHKKANKCPGPWRQYRDLNIYVNPLGDVKYKKGKSEYLYTKSIFLSRKNTLKQDVIYTKNRRYYVKRLVWECFNGEIPEGYAVIHKVGNRNDALSNLKLMKTADYCRQHSKVSNARFVIDKTHNKVYKGSTEAAKYLGIHRITVQRYCNGKIKEPAYDLCWGGLVSGKDL